MLGQELLHQGQSGGAIEQWRKVIQIRPSYSEAVYNLSRLLTKTNPEEAQHLTQEFQAQLAEQHITDRAQTLGNFALTSADARDWPTAIAQLKEGIQLCGDCSAKPQLHKDLGLIYCRSGDLKNGRDELLEARKLSPGDPDVTQALNIIAAMQKQCAGFGG
jgi:Flp pilus assembly protein TadD